MLTWLLASVALASADCPDVSAQVAEARAAYNEAELSRAKEALKVGYDSLSCQDQVVPSEVLLELYRLDGLLSLTLEDQKGAVYATIRAVAVDYQWGEPPPEYGPELIALYQSWSQRLAESLIQVTVIDGGTIWIDGKAVDRHNPRWMVQGEHLVQRQRPNGMRSEVQELSVDQAIVTGVPLPEGEAPISPLDRALEPPKPDEEAAAAVPVEPRLSIRPERRHPTWLFATGAVLGAAGGGLLGLAWQQEQQFLADPYDADRYFRCTKAHVCYGEARQYTIEADARRIRGLYGGGYAALGLGAAALGVGLVGLPVRTDGRTVSVQVEF